MQDSSESYLLYKFIDNLGSTNFSVLRVDDTTDEVGSKQSETNEKGQFVSLDEFNNSKDELSVLEKRLCN